MKVTLKHIIEDIINDEQISNQWICTLLKSIMNRLEGEMNGNQRISHQSKTE